MHGELSDTERQSTLAAYTSGEAQVIVNVAVLTEGWDYPPTSCVVLLRPSSYKSTMVQMIGRGLRTIDPAEYPDVIKKDCIVLDFGTASLVHGSLEQEVNLDDQLANGDAPEKECPECHAVVPAASKECALCGYVWPLGAGGIPQILHSQDFVMTEIDLLKRSNFLWCDLNNDDRCFVATGFKAWAGVLYRNGNWHAVGGIENQKTQLLASGERLVCFASADDYLNMNESEDAAHKTRAWLHQPATEKQLQYLPPSCRHDYNLSRYKASALLRMHFKRRDIQQILHNARAH